MALAIGLGVYCLPAVRGGWDTQAPLWYLLFLACVLQARARSLYVTVFILAGRYFEARAKRRSGAALRALLDLGAKDVAVVRDSIRRQLDQPIKNKDRKCRDDHARRVGRERSA